ncbi:class I SAM-dependent methyltransferase [Shewanella sp. UCD-KL21]|uniref:class I SAM-dependent DNA methyltransferase n=1 Tax=Shewanella sp. UCD-KL21 TaxID=1917164 RepID=UPI00097133F5|nr:class I SAM-dependent methyltransferase [Shewanella sp. UCD-KL21]
MDKYQQTVSVFDKTADKYQQKYMDCALYAHSLDKFAGLILTEFTSEPRSQLTYKTEAAIAMFDIGCGPGNASLYLQQVLSGQLNVSINITGVDLSAAMITLAREYNPAATFEVNDIRQIAATKNKFNVLLCSFCLPYLAKSDIAPFIESLAKVSTPQALVYIGFMQGDYSQSCVQESAEGDKLHMYFYQPAFITSLLSQYDFEIVDSFTEDHIVDGQKMATDRFIFARKK